MSLRFEWDPNKAEANLAKHEISFEEAMTVFADPLARIFPDEEHSVDELREIIIGHSAGQQLILVNFTSIDDRVRIFSARIATRRERKIMKKTSVRKKKPVAEETLRSEYRFDYSKSKPNRFAAKISKGSVAVVLEPDVAEIFGSSEVVNDLLRSIIAAIPSSKRDRRANRAT